MRQATLTTAILFITNLLCAQSKPLPMTMANATNFGQQSTYLKVVDEKNIVCDAPKLTQAAFSRFMRKVPSKLQTEYMELQLFSYWISHNQPLEFESVGLDFFQYLESNKLQRNSRYEEVCYKLNPHSSSSIVKLNRELKNQLRGNKMQLTKK